MIWIKYPLYWYEWCKNEYWIDWNGLILYCWRISCFGVCWMKNDIEWMKLLVYVSIVWLSPWKCYFLLFYRFQWIVHRIYLLWFQFEYSNTIFSIWRVVVVFTLSNWKKWYNNYFEMLMHYLCGIELFFYPIDMKWENWLNPDPLPFDCSWFQLNNDS